MNVFRELPGRNEGLKPVDGEIREQDAPLFKPDVERTNIRPADASDPFQSAFQKLGLSSDTWEKCERSCGYEPDSLQKGDDGRYRDVNTGKEYDSVDAWEKSQEMLAKRYEDAADYFHDKAQKEWESFRNSNENEISEAQRWKNYHKSIEYDAKAEAFREKADELRKQINGSAESERESVLPVKDCGSEATDVNPPTQNKLDGLAREQDVSSELQKQYPSEEGYQIIEEAYLRDKDGKIVRDSETGEARRIDFVVVKDDKVVDSIEVTSMTADKTKQTAKENRIRESGGNYIYDRGRQILVEISPDVQTRIERRE